MLEQRAREMAKHEELELPMPGGALERAAATSRDPAHQAFLDQRTAA